MSEENIIDHGEQQVFLGESLVEKVVPCESDLHFVEVHLSGKEEPLRLHEALFSVMQSHEPVPVSDISEIKWNCLAKNFLALMVEWDLTVLDAASVGRYMHNLIRNTYVDATKKLWDNKIEDNVPLRKVQEIIENV